MALDVVHDQRMKTIMSLEQLTTLGAIKQFLEGTRAVAFNVATDKRERYRWAQKTLVKHRYLTLGKTDRGIVTRYLMKVTGYSLAQTKRLIRQYVETGTILVRPARRNGFKRAYAEADIPGVETPAIPDEPDDSTPVMWWKGLWEVVWRRVVWHFLVGGWGSDRPWLCQSFWWGNAELVAGKLKNWKGFLKPNFEPGPSMRRFDSDHEQVIRHSHPGGTE